MLRHSLLLALSVCCLSLLACKDKASEPAKATPASSASEPAAGEKTKGGRSGRTQTVNTALSKTIDLPRLLETQGNVQALDEVDIRPQKNGMVTAIHFKEGDELRKGQLLFSLDARDDHANVSKAEAAVVSAEVALSIAQRELKRSQDLSEKQFITPSALDTTRSKVDTASAALAQSKAALEQARVSQSYTRIHAPFDGRAGLINVRPGSLVTSNATSTALVRLTRMNPIGVSFTLPERDLPALQNAMRLGPVKLKAISSTQEALHGQIIFVDSSVDRSAGTLLIKARLDNSERRVWPGQYVALQIEAGRWENVVTLPAQAVLNSPNGRLVYAVKEDSTVEAHAVELLQISGEQAIIKGLPAGLKIVVEGGQNLRPGSKVSEARSEGKGKRGKKTEATPTEGKTATPSGIKIPEGFSPRDPERWAAASDEQKQAMIDRWRERQAAKAAAQ